jgi:uncharacterized phage-associated protein
LIPDAYDEFNYDAFLKKHYKKIFEEELGAWATDPVVWPKNRTYAMFSKWFKVLPSEMVFEMGNFAHRS